MSKLISFDEFVSYLHDWNNENQYTNGQAEHATSLGIAFCTYIGVDDDVELKNTTNTRHAIRLILTRYVNDKPGA